jgi:hypothetical protein
LRGWTRITRFFAAAIPPFGRRKGGAEFIPHLIDNDSGVGTQVTAGDLNKDGKPDVIVANKKGVFVFTQQ